VQSVSIPLHVKGEARGVLHLEVVPAKIGVGLRIREVKANLMLGATGLVVAVGLGVAIFFHYSVRSPIRQLSETMEDAAEGNLSALVDIRTGEFGWLASTYNRMMRRLKQSVDENDTLLEQIKTFNLELRGKVEAATAELAAKNTQLEGANERLHNLQRRLTSLFYVLGGATATTSYTLTLSKHGQPVSVQRPPAAEVTEASPAQYRTL